MAATFRFYQCNAKVMINLLKVISGKNLAQNKVCKKQLKNFKASLAIGH